MSVPTDWAGLARRALAASRLRESRRPLAVKRGFVMVHGSGDLGLGGSDVAGLDRLARTWSDIDRFYAPGAGVIKLLADGTWRQVDRNGEPVVA